MLVLLSFALVLAATVLLVLGLLNDGLTLIYLSIACSIAAAVVLVVALRRNKPRAEVKALPEPLPIEREPVVAPTPAPVATPPPAPVAASVAASDPTGTSSEWLASDFAAVDDEVDEGEVDFPIADYDDLTAGQILPLLPQLYADEIGVVEARELATKGRPEILDRLAQLRGDVPAPVAPAAAPAAWAEEEDDWFPIEDYESLSAAQIRPLLGELDEEELALVRDRELALGRRRSLLDDIERRLAGPGTAAFAATPVTSEPAPAAPPEEPTAEEVAAEEVAAAPPAEEGPAEKAAPAKKAPAKKKASAKKAAPAKKASAKQAGPAKKASAKKAAPAKKAVAKKAAAPAKKATKKSS